MTTKKILLTLTIGFLAVSLAFASAPPPPPGGYAGGACRGRKAGSPPGPTTGPLGPPLGGSPIGEGAYIFLLMGLGYAAKKVYVMKTSSKSEEEI